MPFFSYEFLEMNGIAIVLTFCCTAASEGRDGQKWPVTSVELYGRRASSQRHHSCCLTGQLVVLWRQKRCLHLTVCNLILDTLAGIIIRIVICVTHCCWSYLWTSDKARCYFHSLARQRHWPIYKRWSNLQRSLAVSQVESRLLDICLYLSVNLME